MAKHVSVLPLLRAASEALQVGQLIHGEAFSLFEAMSAMEVGNAKMDAAAAAQANTSAPRSAAPPVWDLDNSSTLSVLDHAVVLEAAWVAGNSIAETVYACSYMLEHSSSPAGSVVQAFYAGAKATCSAIWEIALQGGVCEEEDFNINALNNFSSDDVRAVCDQAKPLLVSAITSLTKSASGADAPDHASQLAHLRLRLALMEGLQLLLGIHPDSGTRGSSSSSSGSANGSGSAKGKRSAAAVKAASASVNALAAAEADMADATAKFTDALACLKELEPRFQAAAAPSAPASSSGLDTVSAVPAAQAGHPADPSTRACCCPDANRHLLGPAPPRMLQMLTPQQAYKYLHNMLQHLRYVAAHICDASSYRPLQHLLYTFSSLNPGAVARSAMHLLLSPHRWDGTGSLGVGSSTSPLPPWVPSHESVAESCGVTGLGAINSEAEMFLEQAVIAAGNWCQAMLMNKCRCRRRLRRGLEDWENMYHHGTNADLTPQLAVALRKQGWKHLPGDEPDGYMGVLSSWAEYQTCKSMLLFLLMGFELNLYQPYEYAFVFWYCDYLCNSMNQILVDLMRRRAPASAAAARDEAARLRHHTSMVEAVEVEVLGLLCQGLLRTLAALSANGSVPTPSLTFSSVQEQFEQRFRVFGPVTHPPLLAWQDYEASMSMAGKQPQDVLQSAAASFSQVRARVAWLVASTGSSPQQTQSQGKAQAQQPSHIEQEARWKALERVAVLNSIACGVLAKKLERGDSDKGQVALEFTAHPYFPTLVLPKSK